MFITSNDTRVLFQRLMDAKVGDLISYAELGGLIDKEVSGSTGCLITARKQCKREGSIFGCEFGIGIKRLNDVEIVATSAQAMTRIRGAARRSASTLTKVSDFNAMPEDIKRQHNASLSMLGALAQMTRPKVIERFEQQVDSSTPLSFNKTLAMFAEK